MEIDEWDSISFARSSVEWLLRNQNGEAVTQRNQVIFLPRLMWPPVPRIRPDDPLTLVMVCFYDRTFSGNTAAVEVFFAFFGNTSPQPHP